MKRQAKKQDRHPTRQRKRAGRKIDIGPTELLTAESTKTSVVSSSTGRRALQRLPADALTRIEAIPLTVETAQTPDRVTGGVVYDSWNNGQSLAMRDVADGHVRVLRLKAGRIMVELVAERRRDDWDFVARIKRGNRVEHSFVLIAGARRLLAGTGGYYHWTSRQVPRLIRLVSYKQSVMFESVTWR